MKIHTRREFVAIGLSLAFIGSGDASVDVMEKDLSSATATIIEAFRKAVFMLREAAEPSVLEMRVLEVENLGRSLVGLGISRINPQQAVDGACNHWLASIQRPGF
jgi:hypothetical protein